MFANKDYENYIETQIYADNIWQLYGDCQKADEAQMKANAAFENYEYESGIRSYEYD